MKHIYTTLFAAIMAIGLLMTGCGGAPDISGTWKSGCSPTTGDYFVDITWTFDPPNRTIDADYYLDADCTGALFIYNTLTTSETTLTGESIVNLQDETVWEYDHVIDDIILTPAAISIEIMNDAVQCEIDDWVADVGRSVLGKNCSGSQLPENGDLLEEVFQLLDETTLQLGFAGEADGGREEELDANRTYTKQ